MGRCSSAVRSCRGRSDHEETETPARGAAAAAGAEEEGRDDAAAAVEEDDDEDVAARATDFTGDPGAPGGSPGVARWAAESGRLLETEERRSCEPPTTTGVDPVRDERRSVTAIGLPIAIVEFEDCLVGAMDTSASRAILSAGYTGATPNASTAALSTKSGATVLG